MLEVDLLMLNVLWKYHLLVSPRKMLCKMLVKVRQ